MRQTREQGALTRKQAALLREQRIRKRRERARLKILTEERVKAPVPRSAKILGWVPRAGTIFSITFGIIVSIAAIWVAVWSTE